MTYRLIFCLFALMFSIVLNAQKQLAELQFVSIHPTPVIGKGYKGAEDAKFGFEGGTTQKVKGVYYVFTTEIVDTPKTVQVRLAIWSSSNAIASNSKCAVVDQKHQDTAWTN